MLMATMNASLDEVATTADVDHALARAFAGGDVTAFEALYRRHVGRVHGVILRLVGHQHSRAEDLTQEAFVRAWQALPGFRFESAVGTWLHRLAANTALMAARFDYTNQNLKIAKLQAQDLRRKITYERAHARNVRLVFIAASSTTVVIIAMLVFGIVTIRRSRNE